MKKKLLLMAACLGAMFAFTACGSKDDGNTLTVLNYGKYIESSVLDAFEEETGIHVNYEESGGNVYEIQIRCDRLRCDLHL